MDINYELYKVFFYVATTLSFSEASKQLYISQSAVSQSVKSLEKKLNQVLFIRSTKKVQLTPEGEILLRHIEPAVNLIKRGESQILESASTGGQIRIGASDMTLQYYLLPYRRQRHHLPLFPGPLPGTLSPGFSQRPYQGDQRYFCAVRGTSSERAGRLNRQQFSQPQSGKRAYRQKAENLPRCFHRRGGLFGTQRKNLTFQELLRYPIMMLDRKSTTSEFLHSQFQRYQLDLVPEIELSSNDLLTDLARIGLGIAFIPDYCVPDSSQGIFTVKTRETLPERELVLAYSRHVPLSHAVREFIRCFPEASPDEA